MSESIWPETTLGWLPARCPDCRRAPCCCELKARVECAERRAAEAIAEAHRFRELWEAAASCLQHNRQAIKPRGEDERRMLDAAEQCGCGHFWSGKTSGWLPEQAAGAKDAT